MVKRAIVYLDGYNFYYGILRDGPYKWLDTYALFQEILRIQDPNIVLDKVNYFTSPAKARYSRNGQRSEHAQNMYHKALKQLYKPKKLAIILGNHDINAVYLPRAPKDKGPIDRDDTERVWRVVEKKTDIQIAIEMYADAAKNACEVIILCTNDTDLEPALTRIRSDFPSIEIGFVAAAPPVNNSTPHGRRPNKSLKKIANWTRNAITEDELARAQLPSPINTGNGTAIKPKHWDL